MKKIVAGNFKTNHTRKTTKDFLDSFDSRVSKSRIDSLAYIFPPNTALLENSYGSVKIGTQNCYPAKNGAFTGEIGVEQVSEFGIDSVMVGHSERRTILGETQKICVDKFSFFSSLDMEIFYCIGENIEVRNSGAKSVKEHIKSQFDGIDLGYKRLIVAYEPIWAIGSGITATTEQIEETHAIIRELFSGDILYGGSVKPENARDIMSIKNVDGVLVGGASLCVDSFFEIYRNSK